MKASPYFDERMHDVFFHDVDSNFDADSAEYFEFLGKCIEEDDLYYRENLSSNQYE